MKKINKLINKKLKQKYVKIGKLTFTVLLIIKYIIKIKF